VVPLAFTHIARAHLVRYPLMQIEDLYKLCHQAALGSEHAVSDVQAARDGVMRELAGLVGDPEEPSIDPISPDGRILRVHLRPFVAAGSDPEELLQAFVRTANGFKGSMSQLRRYWACVVELSTDGQIPFDLGDVLRFLEKMETASFAAVHHSAQYQAAYQPSYRVVARGFLPAGWLQEPPSMG
jgi:hypothetical protein